MPRIQWPLQNGRPCVQIVLTSGQDGPSLPLTLLADTGAGARGRGLEFILRDKDCVLCGGSSHQPIALGGAYIGSFPTYILNVQIPALGFARNTRVVAVPSPPRRFDGIACFSFTYGNFGDPDLFGLET